MTPILKDLRPAQEGSHLHRYDLSYETADGRIKSYEIVSTNKSLTQHTLGTARTGVMIVAFDKPHEHILLANEFRMGVNQTIINLVSGFIDADESPIKAAERELHEETGLQISKILDILPFAFIAPAVTDMTACIIICEAEGTIKASENTVLNIVILAVFCTGAILLCRNLISREPIMPSDRPSVMTSRLVQKNANPIKSLENQTPPDTASEQPIETYGLNLSNDVYPLTEPRKVINDYTESDVDLLARLIMAEMGSDWVPDQLPLAVGSVVLNRIESDLFPDTLYGVIYQTEPVLQYAPVANGHINNTPTERIYNVARFLLENGSVLPANVLYQSESIQGGIYFQYTDSVLQTTTYFCIP